MTAASSTENAGLRARRRKLRLRLRDVAHRADVPEVALRRWERALAMPNPAALRQLARVLLCDEHALRREQVVLMRCATPGEGYATAAPGATGMRERRELPPPGTLRVLDLFCGAGGLSLGFDQLPAFATVCGVDLLPDRIETFVDNHPYARGIAGDVTTLPLSELARLVGPVDVLVGGPPCQGFSSIRPFRKLTEGDPRNSLVEHYVLTLARLEPRWFVFENVVGLMRHERGARLDALLSGLETAGYRVDWRVVDAAAFGVPQHRERVIIVGSRGGRRFQWPTPHHRVTQRSMAGRRPEVLQPSPREAARLAPALTLMQAIGDLPPVQAGQEAHRYAGAAQNAYQRALRRGKRRLTLHRATRHSARMLEIIRQAGKNISALPPGLVRSGFSSCYSRLDANEPSTTLTVNFVHPASNRCIHPHQNRALTPREGARLQSFPDDFRFSGSTAQVVKQIGNAVPPLLGRALASALAESEGV